MTRQVAITGAFDDMCSHSLRLLQEAARFGKVTLLLWSDETVRQAEDRASKFPLTERLYFWQALRYVDRVVSIRSPVEQNTLPSVDGFKPDVWVVEESQDHPQKRAWCHQHDTAYETLHDHKLAGFPVAPLPSAPTSEIRKKILVTGSYDCLHSGHVRFFEEVSGLGDLYVAVGHDANIHLLKGDGHPLVPAEERCYMVGSVRFVRQALITTGHGWLDAEPEIERLRPDVYAVNEDGDRGGKREFCAKHDIEYLVLKRTPAPGLPPRSSTALRGF